MKLGYVIGPFTADTQWGIAENVRRAERAGYIVALHGAMPVIPHANTQNFHGICTPGFWYAGTMELLKRCDFAVTVEIVGVPHAEVMASSGSRKEIEWVLRRQAEAGSGVPFFPLFRDILGLRHYLEPAHG